MFWLVLCILIVAVGIPMGIKTHKKFKEEGSWYEDGLMWATWGI